MKPGDLVESTANPEMFTGTWLHRGDPSDSGVRIGELGLNELGTVVAMYMPSRLSPQRPNDFMVMVLTSQSKLGWCHVSYLKPATGPVNGAPSRSRRGAPIKAP